MNDQPKVFISYSWDSEPHKQWVKEFATQLRADGIDILLDQWETAPGDQLPSFMECSVRESDFVLIICTPDYKVKSDKRHGGVGYEGDIMTGEVWANKNSKKFIPLLRFGEWNEAAPTWLSGKMYIDFRESTNSKESYDNLVDTIFDRREKAPPIGKNNKNIDQLLIRLEYLNSFVHVSPKKVCFVFRGSLNHIMLLSELMLKYEPFGFEYAIENNDQFEGELLFIAYGSGSYKEKFHDLQKLASTVHVVCLGAQIPG